MSGGTSSQGLGPLKYALAVVGAGGALIGWVALVGGIMEYGRFEAAGIPSPAQSASLLPRDALFAEGMSALVPVLIVGAVVATFAYGLVRVAQRPLGRWCAKPGGSGGRPARRPVWADVGRTPSEGDLMAAAVVVVVAVCVGEVVIGKHLHSSGWSPVVALILALSVWFPFRLGWLRAPCAVPVVVFVVIILYGGTAAFVQALHENKGKFDWAIIVRRKGLEEVTGFYLTRSGGYVDVAVYPPPTSKAAGDGTSKEKLVKGDGKKKSASNHDEFAIMEVPEEQVETIEIGPAYELKSGKPEKKVPVTESKKPKGPRIKLVPPGSSEQEPPVAQVFALDKVVPARDHFCFRVGASNEAETLGLAFTAPTLRPRDGGFTHIAPFKLTARGEKNVHVGLGPTIQARLRNGKRLTVDIKIRATAGAATSTTAYHLQLLQPGGRPLPTGPGWEKGPDSEHCPEPAIRRAGSGRKSVAS